MCIRDSTGAVNSEKYEEDTARTKSRYPLRRRIGRGGDQGRAESDREGGRHGLSGRADLRRDQKGRGALLLDRFLHGLDLRPVRSVGVEDTDFSSLQCLLHIFLN